MLNENAGTEFAPPERCEDEVIYSQAEILNNLPMIHQLVDLLPEAFLILNRQRQIVFCNKTFMDMMTVSEQKAICGKRPGEALNCIHADETDGGCGTTGFCEYCGAVNAILKSQYNPAELHSEECRITAGPDNKAMTFRVWSKQLSVENDSYTIFIARDISSEKRRSSLEKIFFHDILNTAGGIQGVVSLLESADRNELDELIGLISFTSETLIEEIKAQKDILAAESGELKVNRSVFNTKEMLEAIYKIYLKHEVSLDKYISIAENSASVDISSDPRILKRIMGNMLKNALEASNDGETVTLGAAERDNYIDFWVHNPGVMPKEAKMQVFQRSFSTKGNDRGLGTYSIKLLGENFLKGKVSFISEEKTGTVFTFTIEK